MDEIFSKFTDKYNCESSNDEYFIPSQRQIDKNEIEQKFRKSNQTYVFPRTRIYSSSSNSSVQSVVDLKACIKQTIESPQRLKTEGNEQSEDQIDLNFNFNSSSEHLSEDVAILQQPRPYKQKLKPPRVQDKPSYNTILNDLERKLQTLNKSKQIGRVKSNSNSITNYTSQHYKTNKPFRQGTPQQTKASSIQKKESKKSLSKMTCQDYLLKILQKNKSKSNEGRMGPIFNVNNSNINLNVNINSQTIDVNRKQFKRPKELMEQTITVAQILKKNKLLTHNRSTASSQQQRYSNRCSTEPLDDMSLQQRFKKKKAPIRCNTVMENQPMQSTQQYLNQLKKQQQCSSKQCSSKQSFQHHTTNQRNSSKGSIGKYKKNLRIE